MSATVPVQNMTLLPVGDLWPGKRAHAQTQAYGCLRRAGIDRIGHLAGWSAADLLDLRQFGAGCLAEVERALHAQGLNLRGDES